MKNIVLIYLDCIRKESLSCYPDRYDSLIHRTLSPFYSGSLKLPIYGFIDNFLKEHVKPYTPNIDNIAKEGSLFTQFVSQSPFTPNSHASMLTGLNPFHHGIRAMIGFKLNNNVTTFAEILKSNGYATGGFIGSNALSSYYGLDRVFDVYDFKADSFLCRVGPLKIVKRDCKKVTKSALDWLESVKKNNFLLFIHYFDANTHDVFNISYSPFYQIIKVKEIDFYIGKVVRFLKDHKLYDDSIIIIMADHGNSFGVHEDWHREYLFDSTILIPAIMKTNNMISDKVISKQFRSIDVVPTILDILGIDRKSFNLDGVNIKEALTNLSNQELLAYSETCNELSENEWNKYRSSFASLRTPKWKVIFDKLKREKKLFNLKNDKNEILDVYKENIGRGDELVKELFELAGNNFYFENKDYVSNSETEEIKQSLKSLGYL